MPSFDTILLEQNLKSVKDLKCPQLDKMSPKGAGHSEGDWIVGALHLAECAAYS